MSDSALSIPFDEGDTLVNEKGTVTVDVNEIDGETVHCEDSRRHMDGDYSVEEMVDAVEKGHFDVISDSRLTDVKGIGASTAPEIEAKTGCETPSELVEAYLCEPNSRVRDAVRRVDHLNEWLVEHISDLDADITERELKVMLFLLEYDCEPRYSSLDDTYDVVDSKRNSVDGEALTTSHLSWDGDSLWIGSAQVVGVFGSWDSLVSFQSHDYWEDYETVANHHESDSGEYVAFIPDSGHESRVTKSMLSPLEEIFTFNRDDVMAHPDGEYPIMAKDEDTGMYVTMAPRVMSN